MSRISTRLVPCLVLPALAGALLSGPLARPAAAQESGESPPTLVVSQWKCDWAEVGHIMATTDSVSVPIWRQVIDEGLLIDAGSMVHQWGDEWNIGFWWVAPDTRTFLDAYDRINELTAEGHPNLEPLTDLCSEHRDNIYTAGPSAGNPASGGDGM